MSEPLFAGGDDLHQIVESIALNGTDQLLDLGTGAGHVAIAFAAHVAQCSGVDVSERMIRIASDNAQDRGIAYHLRGASLRCKETFRVDLDSHGDPRSFCLKAALFHGTKGTGRKR